MRHHGRTPEAGDESVQPELFPALRVDPQSLKPTKVSSKEEPAVVKDPEALDVEEVISSPIPYALVPGRNGLLKAPNQSVLMRTHRGDLNVVRKRLWFVCLYLAMKQGIEEKREFDALAIDVMREAGLESTNDRQYIKNHIRSLVTTSIEWGWGDGNHSPSEPVWQVTTLMADATFYYDEEGFLRLKWTYSDALRRQLMMKGPFTKLELELLRQFDTLPSLSLFTIASRYLGNPSKVSRKADLATWVLLLRGKPITEYKDLDYTRFRRETVEKAIEKVNEVAKDRFEVRLNPVKTGRTVTHLQLEISVRNAPLMERLNEQDVDPALINEMLVMKIKHADALNLFGATELGILRQAVKETSARFAKGVTGQLDPLNSPLAYLRDRIAKITRNREEPDGPLFAASPTNESRAQEEARKHLAEARAQWLSAWEDNESARVRALFKEATKEQQAQWLRTFESDELPGLPPTVESNFRKKGLDSPFVASAFYKWMRRVHHVQQPSDSQLLEFAVTRGLLKMTA